MDLYCSSSGQQVSDGKSSIFFSPNTIVERRVEVCTRLNIMIEALTDKYLGLPLLVGAEISDSFQYLIDKICEILHGWKEKNVIHGWQRGVSEGYGSASISICNVCIQHPKVNLQRDNGCDSAILVGG